MGKSLQIQLFEHIFRQYPRRSDAVSEIASILNLSKDSTYRRVRGETLLTSEGLMNLALRFKISLDSLIYQNHDVVLFQYRPMTKPIKNFDEYLKDIFYDMKRLHHTPKHRLFYASSDIPIFLFLSIPELTSIKMYIWGRMIWNFDYLKEYAFDFDVLPPSTQILAKEVAKHYYQIPSTDIWSINILDNTLNQIDHLINIGGFKDLNDAIIICEKLLELVNTMKYMAEKGKKGNNKANIDASDIDFELYHNEIAHTNNTVLASSEEGKVIFTSYDNPNFLRSTDQKFGENTEIWFNKVIAQSSSISVNTERKRQWFFNVLDSKVTTLQKRIKLMIEEQQIPIFL